MTQGVQPDTLWWHWEVGCGVGRRLKREGLYIHLGLIHVIWQKPTQHCTAMIPQLKKKIWSGNKLIKIQRNIKTEAQCGKRRGWDDLREWHWNMYIIICETDCQSRFDAWDRVLRVVHWVDQERWDGEGGERGFRMRKTCKSTADSCQCMAKTTTIL